MPEIKKQNLAKRVERDHPVTSDDSPLNRHICRAANVPDVKSLLMALAHPMTDDDIHKLGQKAGNHPAHHNRVKHLREHAIKKHGRVGETPPEDKSNTSEPSDVKDETGGLGQYNYGPKFQKKSLNKAVSMMTGGETAGLGRNRVTGEAQTPMGGQTYSQSPSTGTQTPTGGITTRNAPGSQAYSPSVRGKDNQNLYVDAAGQTQVGPKTHTPFAARLKFDPNNQHEQNVKNFLGKHSWELTRQQKAPEDMGNHILFQDLMPDPKDHTYGLGMDRNNEDRKLVAQWMHKTGKATSVDHAHDLLDAHNSQERRAMADMIAKEHPGTTSENAMEVLNKLHQQALLQFKAHPMHDMGHTMMGKEVTVPKFDSQGNQIGTEVQRTQEDAVPKDENGKPIYNGGTKPLEYQHFGRQARLWGSIDPKVRDQTRKWYDSEADNFIKDLSYASRTHYMKVAGVLAQLNNSLGWETGATGAVQWVLNNMERKKAGDTRPLIPTNAYGARYTVNGEHNQQEHDGQGGLRYKVGPGKDGAVPHEAGDPKIVKPVQSDQMDAIREILDSGSSGDKEKDMKDMLGTIRKHLATQKLGNFFMDMVGSAPWHTNTQDRHQLASSGHIASDGSGFAQGPRKQDEDFRYFWRNQHAVADMLGVPAREVQAANWVKWRRDKGETAQGSANQDLPAARAALDEAMRNRAKEDGDPHFIGRVEGWIANRQKRERNMERLQPTTPAEQAGRDKAEKDLEDTMKDNALDKMWKPVEAALPGGIPLEGQYVKQTAKEKKAKVAPTITGYKTTRTGGPRKVATKQLGTALGKISTERKKQLSDAADKIPGLRELLGLDDVLGKSFHYHMLLQKAIEEAEWLDSLDRWDDDYHDPLTFIVVRR